MNLKTKQSLSVIFSLVGVAGTIGTAFLTRKASLKEAVLRHEIDYQVAHGHEKEPTTKEFIKKVLPLYIPSIVAGTATVASIVGSTIMSQKAQASIMSMAVVADQGWRRYKNQIKEKLGLDTHKDILKNIAREHHPIVNPNEVPEGHQLYFEEIIGYFTAKPEDVQAAYAKINELFNTDAKLGEDDYGVITLKDFIKFSKAEVLHTTAKNSILDSWGWTQDYLLDNFDWSWVHIKLENEKTDDGVVDFQVITWIEEPIFISEMHKYTMDVIEVMDGEE